MSAAQYKANYGIVRHQIRDGDLLLWRPTSFREKLIRFGSRGPYSHAGMAAWVRKPDGCPSVLMSLEILVHKGGTIHPLSEYVKQYPGAIDVFSSAAANRFPGWDREQTVEWMWRTTSGLAYDKRSLWKIAKTYLFLRSPDSDDLAEASGVAICSAFCSMAIQQGGVDPVPNLAPHDTSPNDLARSPFFAYKFTLFS